MTALHSEILLVDADDQQLYSWPCSDMKSSSALQPHPLSPELGLCGEEKVALMGSSDIRATIVTESGKVATFYDTLIRCECSCTFTYGMYMYIFGYVLCTLT